MMNYTLSNRIFFKNHYDERITDNGYYEPLTLKNNNIRRSVYARIILNNHLKYNRHQRSKVLQDRKFKY